MGAWVFMQIAYEYFSCFFCFVVRFRRIPKYLRSPSINEIYNNLCDLYLITKWRTKSCREKTGQLSTFPTMRVCQRFICPIHKLNRWVKLPIIQHERKDTKSFGLRFWNRRNSNTNDTNSLDYNAGQVPEEMFISQWTVKFDFVWLISQPKSFSTPWYVHTR